MQAVRGRLVSMVFQDPLASLNPVFTIGEQIERRRAPPQGLSAQGGPRGGTHAALARAGLPADDDMLESYPHQFSGGMRQRACMAMAISCDSPLLIADEPTTALDVTIQAQILDLLLDLRAELGVAQILITHNVGVAAQTCDRVAVMYAGSVVEQGTASEVLKHSAPPVHDRPLRVPAARQDGRRAADHPRLGARPDRPALGLPIPPALRARDGGLRDGQA